MRAESTPQRLAATTRARTEGPLRFQLGARCRRCAAPRHAQIAAAVARALSAALDAAPIALGAHCTCRAFATSSAGGP